jgi:hypothetical protein
MEEIDHADAKTCRDQATTFCVAKLATPGQGLQKARDKFVEKAVLACTPAGQTAVCSTNPGGLYLDNLPFCCSTSPDLQSLFVCVRGLLDGMVDQDAGLAMPRAGRLLDNIGLGWVSGALLRPFSTTVTLTQSSGNLNSPGIINVPATQSLEFNATALPCGSNSGNGTLEVRVGSQGTGCGDLVADQTVTMKEDGYALYPLYVGPFDQNMLYCITWKDPGGGGCTSGPGSSVFGQIVVSGGSMPPTTPASRTTVLACQNKFRSQGKAIASFVANKLHACGDKVAKCELANEIDGSGTCTPSYTTPCSTIDTSIDNKLVSSAGKITAVPGTCSSIAFTQLQSFVGGLGFKIGSCGSLTDLNSLAQCVLGQPNMSTGVKCFVEYASHYRDPRLKQSLIAAGLNPSVDFPCIP